MAFAIAMTWHSRLFAALEPAWLAQAIIDHPISKTDLHPLRFMHFLALAIVALRFVPRKWIAWEWPGFRSAILCGQHSLEIFCAGVFLAFAAHFVLIELWSGILAEVVVSASGIALMIGLAALLAWYRSLEAPDRERLQPPAASRLAESRSRGRVATSTIGRLARGPNPIPDRTRKGGMRASSENM